jgi:predicted 3-demethylubiquinone-9 3-methyltransferase (glyoxalase superfamily)
MKSISTCLWFDHQAEVAAEFYTKIFNGRIEQVTRYTVVSAKQTGRPLDSVMTAQFTIADQKIVGLNGGPIFTFSPSFSYYVSCDSKEEINLLWSQLSEGGSIRFPLGKQEWSEHYGFTADRFGVEWQLTLDQGPTKISPCFLFTDAFYGKGQEAVRFYTSLFPNSKIEMNAIDPQSGITQFCAFTLNGQSFKLMEGQSKYTHSFNESMSVVVNCTTQAEIDTYWNKLTSEGGSPSQCGWLKDRFGVSWQIVPANLEKYAQDPHKFEKVMAVVMKMTKLDLAEMDRAANA